MSLQEKIPMSGAPRALLAFTPDEMRTLRKSLRFFHALSLGSVKVATCPDRREEFGLDFEESRDLLARLNRVQV